VADILTYDIFYRLIEYSSRQATSGFTTVYDLTKCNKFTSGQMLLNKQIRYDRT